jgi:integrase
MSQFCYKKPYKSAEKVNKNGQYSILRRYRFQQGNSNPATPTSKNPYKIAGNGDFVRNNKSVAPIVAVTATKVKRSFIQKMIPKEGEKYDYHPPRLVNYADAEHPHGDISKRWKIVFYAYNIDTNRLERKYFTQINKSKNIRKRLQAARTAIREITHMLETGWHISNKKEVKTDKPLFYGRLLKDAMAEVVEIRKKEVGSHHSRSFKTITEHFLPFISDKMKTQQVDSDLLLKYRDHLRKIKKEVANGTINNYMASLISCINYMRKRDKKLRNALPDIEINKLPESKNLHAAYSMDQMAAIKKETLKRGDQQFLLFISTMFYCGARPKEIRLMKVEQVEFDRNVIWIPDEDSKNKRGHYITLFAPLREMMLEYGLQDCQPDDYIFTADQRPGAEPVGINYFYKRNRAILKALGLDKSKKDYTLYSYKHSGAINMVESGMDIHDISRQLRHATINQTQEYLRDLHLLRPADQEIKRF